MYPHADQGEMMAIQWLTLESMRWKDCISPWADLSSRERRAVDSVFAEWEQATSVYHSAIRNVFVVHADASYIEPYRLVLGSQDYDTREMWASGETAARTRLLAGSPPGLYDNEMEEVDLYSFTGTDDGNCSLPMARYAIDVSISQDWQRSLVTRTVFLRLKYVR